jgi:predicted ester cyclase
MNRVGDEPAGDGLRELIGRFYERLWNAWDDRAVDDVLCEDFLFRGSLGQETHGRDGWRAYRDQVRSGAPDFHNEVIELVVGGDRAAARLRYTGTHRGPLLGLAGTGQRFVYEGAAFFRAQSGTLAEAWVIGDLDGLRRQLAGGE